MVDGTVRVVVARKEHHCTLCDWPIPKGDPHETWTLAPSMWDGDYWFTGHAHILCLAIWSAHEDSIYRDDALPDPCEFRSEYLAYAESVEGRHVTWREERLDAC